jgi:hypothetical protein
VSWSAGYVEKASCQALLGVLVLESSYWQLPLLSGSHGLALRNLALRCVRGPHCLVVFACGSTNCCVQRAGEHCILILRTKVGGADVY